MELKDLEQILSILRQNDVTEFELEQEGTHLKLCRGQRQQLVAAPHAAHAGNLVVEPAIIGPQPTAAMVQLEAASAQPAVVEADSKLIKVESPLVGPFYRKPSPDSEPFVKEGQVVKKGDTLCIVEAMKLMNEIDSSCSGRIEKILIPDGHVVEYGEVLFLINPEV